MRFLTSLCVALLTLASGVTTAYASDHTAVYALIDKVVLEPNNDHPDRVQVWGVFAIAKPGSFDYLAPQRGYLYFKLADDTQAARNEWADLKSVAGKKQVVAFGSRWKMISTITVRKPDAKPESPDPYITEIGVFKVRSDTDYSPVKSLLEFGGH
jgi:hypothetical protein